MINSRYLLLLLLRAGFLLVAEENPCRVKRTDSGARWPGFKSR